MTTLQLKNYIEEPSDDTGVMTQVMSTDSTHQIVTVIPPAHDSSIHSIGREKPRRSTSIKRTPSIIEETMKLLNCTGEIIKDVHTSQQVELQIC